MKTLCRMGISPWPLSCRRRAYQNGDSKLERRSRPVIHQLPFNWDIVSLFLSAARFSRVIKHVFYLLTNFCPKLRWQQMSVDQHFSHVSTNDRLPVRGTNSVKLSSCRCFVRHYYCSGFFTSYMRISQCINNRQHLSWDQDKTFSFTQDTDYINVYHPLLSLL